MTHEAIVSALAHNVPFQDLPEVAVAPPEPLPEGPLDIKLLLSYGDHTVEVFAEIKNECTPKLVQEIAPWLAGMRALRKDASFALICPALSEEAQRVCTEKGVDFIDLAGNVSINVPGRFLLRRAATRARAPKQASPHRDPFAGKSSRVVRVLLNSPREWTLSEIVRELAAESQRNALGVRDFRISLASASKTVRSLEEDVLVRRRKSWILTPDPLRLLLRWVEVYTRRRRSYQRRSFRCPNPFGGRLSLVSEGLRGLTGDAGFAFTGAAAAATRVPSIEMDVIEVYVEPSGAARLRALDEQPGIGPELRVLEPYDAGVFMYAVKNDGGPVVSAIQTCLDLFARGGRDSKEARLLLAKVVEPGWDRT